MKRRNGFVSNSSSSSFCIYGTYIDKDEFEKKVKKLHPELKDEEDLYELTEKLDISLEIQFPCYYDIAYIGRSWSSVGDKETGKQFKESVEKEIKRVLGKNLNVLHMK